MPVFEKLEHKEKSMCEVSDWKELGNKESGRLQMKQAW